MARADLKKSDTELSQTFRGSAAAPDLYFKVIGTQEEAYMKKQLIAILCTLVIVFSSGCNSSSDHTDDMWALLQEAYIYALPLVLTDATKTAATNIAAPDHAGHAPVNQLIHAATLATAEMHLVVTPNVDTLYTQAWLDLKDEPMLYRAPASDRFFTVQVLDAWTNTVTVLKEAGDYAIVRAGWRGTLPEGVKRVEVPTNTVWLICRLIVDNEEDLPRVHALQNKMRLVPLSAYDTIDTFIPPSGTYDEENDFVPVNHVLAMTPQEFFDAANLLMQDNPPAAEDARAVSRFAKLGIGPGLFFSAEIFGTELADKWREMLTGLRPLLAEEAMNYTQYLGDWSYYGDPVGDFGTAYTYRALVALVGLGANTTEIAIYPKLDRDHYGEKLTGTKRYVLHLDSVPPILANGFWSFTVYGDDDFLIANPIGRYCINDRSSCKYNEDGSLDIIISREAPAEGADNWLPVGENGFHLVLRIYYPDMDALAAWPAPTISLSEG